MLFIKYVQGFLKTLTNLGEFFYGKMGYFDGKTGHFDGKFANFWRFLGIRIVRIFGQKYSRFEYLKIFE